MGGKEVIDEVKCNQVAGESPRASDSLNFEVCGGLVVGGSGGYGCMGGSQKIISQVYESQTEFEG